jgi:hypothetical protein
MTTILDIRTTQVREIDRKLTLLKAYKEDLKKSLHNIDFNADNKNLIARMNDSFAGEVLISISAWKDEEKRKNKQIKLVFPEIEIEDSFFFINSDPVNYRDFIFERDFQNSIKDLEDRGAELLEDLNNRKAFRPSLFGR